MGDRIRLRPEALEWREIDGEVVALDGRESLYLGINRAGAVLWPLLVGGASRDELGLALRERFGLGSVQADRDVDAFLADLSGRGLLER